MLFIKNPQTNGELMYNAVIWAVIRARLWGIVKLVIAILIVGVCIKYLVL